MHSLRQSVVVYKQTSTPLLCKYLLKKLVLSIVIANTGIFNVEDDEMDKTGWRVLKISLIMKYLYSLWIYLHLYNIYVTLYQSTTIN